ncbi:MAG: outer membrane beta-barrel protein [Verrucomicrobiota bacterium]
MRVNKWTLGLAAAGVVSLGSAVQAEETSNTVLTGLSSTTLSGYVDTSAMWNFGTGNANPVPVRFNQGKQDGFNLNVVQLSLARPLSENNWAAGYRVDLWMGPDAAQLDTASLQSGFTQGDLAIRQAYVALRTPLGNDIEWKIGVFDSIIGYESVASPSDPNYTRSYGNTLEPTSNTGLLASYRFCEEFNISAGIANTVGPNINQRAFNTPGVPPLTNPQAESFKTYMGSFTVVAPDSLGFLAGSSLYGGIVNGFNDAVNETAYQNNSTSYYLGATFVTPVNGLRFGTAFDWLHIHNWSEVLASAPVPLFGGDGNSWSLGLYGSLQATEAFSIHLRGEYVNDNAGFFFGPFGEDQTGNVVERAQVFEVTTTAQYDLWKNVISRAEFRWDHIEHGNAFGGTIPGSPIYANAYMLAANIIYQF